MLWKSEKQYELPFGNKREINKFVMRSGLLGGSDPNPPKSNNTSSNQSQANYTKTTLSCTWIEINQNFEKNLKDDTTYSMGKNEVCDIKIIPTKNNLVDEVIPKNICNMKKLLKFSIATHTFNSY